MKITKLLATSAVALLASTAAQAQVTGALGTSGGPFATLSGSGLSGAANATFSGGTVYAGDLPFADQPAGSVFGGTFLAAGPSSGTPAILSFLGNYTYLSFLWGSPDLYNELTINTTLGSKSFDISATSLNFSSTSGDQNFSQYVQFWTDPGVYITSVSFASTSADAFEAANFRAAVPEASTWAMMIIGFGAAGAAMRRRRMRTSVRFA